MSAASYQENSTFYPVGDTTYGIQYKTIQLKEYNDLKEYLSRNSVVHTRCSHSVRIKPCESTPETTLDFAGNLRNHLHDGLHKEGGERTASDMFILFSKAKESANDTERCQRGEEGAASCSQS